MTGVIYVVIIALWAAVLIPIWLKRHDQISEVRSTARFSSAMKTLGGRGQLRYASDGTSDVMYPDGPMLDRADQARHHDRSEIRMTKSHEGRSAGRSSLDFDGMDREYERDLVRRAAATRRAIVLGSLTAILLLALILAVVGVLPRWVPILAAIPVVAFVLATAMTASVRSSAGSSRTARPAARRVASESRRAQVAVDQPVTEVADDWENWNAWDDEDDAWDAVPTTLPTYVSAPRASAVPREIDRAHPGEWTGQAMVDTARAMRSRPASQPVGPAADVDYSAETAEIPAVTYDSPRAANQ